MGILIIVPFGVLSILLGIVRVIFRGDKIGKYATIADLITISLIILGFVYFAVTMSSFILLIVVFIECYPFYEVLRDLKNNY